MKLFVEQCQGDTEQRERDDFSTGMDVNCAVKVDKVTAFSRADPAGFAFAAPRGRRRQAAALKVSIWSGDVAAIFAIVNWANGHGNVDDASARRVDSTSTDDAP